MTAAIAPRNTPEIVAKTFSRSVAAGVTIHQGTIVALSAGYAAPGAVGLNLIADGRAAESVSNTGGAAGVVKVRVDKGTYRFASAGGADLIGRTEIGRSAYLVDDQTVAKTDGAGTRSIAGRIMDVDAFGVWVRFD